MGRPTPPCRGSFLRLYFYIPVSSLLIISISNTMDFCSGFYYGLFSWLVMCVCFYHFHLFSVSSFLQGNKLASGALFASLLQFKHIYMYLAVGRQSSLQTFHPTLPYAACILYLSPSVLLYDAIRTTACQEFSVTRQHCHSHFWGFSRTLCFNGPIATARIAPLSIHQRLKSCLLGSQCLGIGHNHRPRAFAM